MNHREIHEAIVKKFNIPMPQECLPLSIRRPFTREQLGELLGELGYNKCVEIGVNYGNHSLHLCNCNPKIELTCIDPWAPRKKYTQDRVDRIYKEAVDKLAPYKVRILKMTSMDALKEVPDESQDFIYVDGDHTYDFVCADIIFWSQKLRSGGIMGCHDYYPLRNGGVVKAVDGYVHCHGINPWYFIKEREPTVFWVKP